MDLDRVKKLSRRGKIIGATVGFFGSIASVLGLALALRLMPPTEYGNCHLKVKEIPSLARINDHFNEGISDVRNNRIDLAISRFKTILDIDPNFLAVQMNLGSALLEQGKLDDAEHAFDAEMSTIDCLRSVKEKDLAKFWYLIDPANKSARATDQAKLQYLQTKIQNDEDAVHYNRALLKVKQKDDEQAIAQLRQAISHNFIPKETLPDDPELKKLKNSPEFQTLVKSGR